MTKLNATEPSLTVEQAITQEANRAIASLNYTFPADLTSVEAVLESLKTVADVVNPMLAKTLEIRLIAIRNNLHVNRVVA